MKIQLASDLHLEFPVNRQFVFDNWTCSGDVLILAGDICPFNRDDLFKEFLARYASNYETIIRVPGNHEYYGSSMEVLESHQGVSIQQGNCFTMNNSSVLVGKVNFVCSTMWSKATKECENMIADYSQIRGLTVDKGNKLHEDSVEYLASKLATKMKGYVFVVTHHLPLLDCTDPMYVGSRLNPAFVSDQTKLLENKIHYWAHGHSHSFQKFGHNDTTVLRNPLGYIHLRENNSPLEYTIELK